jgi:hypothetical protein
LDFESCRHANHGFDALAIIHAKSSSVRYTFEELDQFFLAELGKCGLSDQRQREWGCHHQLAAGKMRNCAAKAVLLHCDKSEMALLCGETRRKSGWSASYDHDIENIRLPEIPQGSNGIDGLSDPDQPARAASTTTLLPTGVR